MKKKLMLLFLVVIFLLFTPTVYALRKRTRKKRSSGGTAQVSQSSRGVKAQIRFRPDRRGLLLNFSGFSEVESVSYQLVYDNNGVSQGVGGAITSEDTSTRELLFATCSGGVCTYHTNITNARLSIITTLKNGTKILKPYRIRV